MRSAAEISREMDAITTEIGDMEHVCAPWRRAVRALKDRIALLCVPAQPQARQVRGWRPVTAAEVAEIDALSARKFQEVGHLEDRIKELEIDMRWLRVELKMAMREEKKQAKAAARKTAKPQIDMFG